MDSLAPPPNGRASPPSDASSAWSLTRDAGWFRGMFQVQPAPRAQRGAYVGGNAGAHGSNIRETGGRSNDSHAGLPVESIASEGRTMRSAKSLTRMRAFTGALAIALLSVAQASRAQDGRQAS